MIDPADHVTQPLPVPAPLALRIDTPTRLMQAELVQDLLGSWMLIQSWTGRQGTRHGRKVTLVDTHEAGLALLHKLQQSLKPATRPEP